MLPALRKDPPGPGFLLSLYQLRLLRSVLSRAPLRDQEALTHVDPLAREAFLNQLDASEKRMKNFIDADRDRFRLVLSDKEAEGFIGLLAERPADCGLRRTFLGQARPEKAVSSPELLAWIDRLSEGASLGIKAFRAGVDVPRAAVEPNRTIWIETDAVFDL